MTADQTSPQTPRILDPMDRIAEVLFGVIMALTFTCTLGVATADSMAVRTMFFAVLGCNLAWGIIDGCVYLLMRLNLRGRALVSWRALRDADDAGAAHRILADALPPLVASLITPGELEAVRRKLRHMPVPARAPLTRRDWLGALAICLLSFASTFPILIPFLFTGDARLALRISNAIAIAMLFTCGFLFARHAGFHPLATGLVMVVLGGAMVGVAIALGG